MKVNLIIILIIAIINIAKTKSINLSMIASYMQGSKSYQMDDKYGITIEDDKEYYVKISTYINESIMNNSNKDNFYICTKYKAKEDKIFNHSIEYFFFDYEKCENNDTFQNISQKIIDDFIFYLANIEKTYLNEEIDYILSLKENYSESIIINFTKKELKFFNSNQIYQDDYNNTVNNDNICNNNTEESISKKFICKIDYLLFGHKDLKKDDVYLAKLVDEKNSIAYFDNFLPYNIFPYKYLDYFLTSFFSELNDECKTELFNKYNQPLYYIKCPKQKINIYTIRRKLSVIINKISYELTDLFRDSLIFLDENKEDNKQVKNEDYYFNIVFVEDGNYFILGKDFLKDKSLGYYNNFTYIYSAVRTNYSDALTDMDSTNFEKWLYALTIASFTFLLIIFGILGFLHKRQVQKELNEMLNS